MMKIIKKLFGLDSGKMKHPAIRSSSPMIFNMPMQIPCDFTAEQLNKALHEQLGTPLDLFRKVSDEEIAEWTRPIPASELQVQPMMKPIGGVYSGLKPIYKGK